MDASLFSGLQLLAAGAEHASDHGGGGHHGPSFWGLAVYFIITIVIILALLSYAKKGFNRRVFTNPIAKAVEQLYFFVENLAVGIIGAHGRKYIPMIMVFWMVIFVGNIIALFAPTSTTADLSFNLGLALVAMGYVQWEGMKANGVIGHFSHFAGPKMGVALIPINLMLFVIEIISETMKNVSLSLRLYGNIDGGHRASDGMNELGVNILRFSEQFALSIPFGAFLMPIKLLTCVVQALIFSLLFSVYLSLVTHHDHGDDHGHGDSHGAPAHAH